MTPPDRYSEPIGDGGTLHVQRDGWYVQWITPGPDRRYNPTIVTFFGNQFREVIATLPIAFDAYVALKTIVPAGGQMTKRYECGITVGVGETLEGVRINGTRTRITTRADLDQRLLQYQRVLDRIPTLKALFTTDTP